MNLSFFVHADNDFAGRASTRFGLSFVPPPPPPKDLLKLIIRGLLRVRRRTVQRCVRVSYKNVYNRSD